MLDETRDVGSREAMMAAVAAGQHRDARIGEVGKAQVRAGCGRLRDAPARPGAAG